MKITQIIRLCIATIALITLSGHAFAWTSTFYDRDSGFSFTHVDATSPEEAAQLAKEGCQKKSAHSDCVQIGEPQHGKIVAIALGTLYTYDDKISVSRYTDDPNRAAEIALEMCRKQARKCHLTLLAWDSGINWAALANNGTDGLFVRANASTRDEAINDAKEGCEKMAAIKGNCKVVEGFTRSTRAWYVVATGDSGARYALSETSLDDAKKTALQHCLEIHGKNCSVTNVVENDAPKAESVTFKMYQAHVERQKAQHKPPIRKSAPIPAGNSDCRRSEAHCAVP